MRWEQSYDGGGGGKGGAGVGRGANMNLMGLNVIVNKKEHFQEECSFLPCDLFLLLVCHEPCRFLRDGGDLEKNLELQRYTIHTQKYICMTNDVDIALMLLCI